MSVTNTQRDEIRKLIERRITTAMEAEKAGHPDDLAAAARVADDPALVELKAQIAAVTAACDAVDLAEKAQEEACEKLRTMLGEKTCSYYRSARDTTTHATTVEVPARRAKVELAALQGTPLGTKLAELQRMRDDLGDLLVLATSQKQLRELVATINRSLDITPSGIEVDILNM